MALRTYARQAINCKTGDQTWQTQAKKINPPKEARLAVLGVAPEFRGKGVAALFYAESLLRGKKKFIGGELSWVEETNEEIIRGITLMGASKYKTYRIFEAPLLSGNA